MTAAVYGRAGLKARGFSEEARALLLRAAAILVDELGCQALVAGCTEIPLALPEATVSGVPLVDPVRVVARLAVARVYGLRSAAGEV